MPPPPPSAAAATATQAWLGTWSRPPDRPAEVAAAVAALLVIVAFVPGGPRWVASLLDFASLGDVSRRRRFLTVAGFVAAFLSLGYIAFYLRGGPRATEAATYWIEGHALSHGEFSWNAPDPTAGFRARYLLFEDGSRLAGIFPPGYPLLLAAGFLVGAPMLVGPLLAAALVVATWLLARELALACGEADPRAEWVARIAAGLSIVSAAMRYHTADTMPHGAAAVAVAAALAFAMRARRTGDARRFALAGLLVGFVVAARPLSAVVVGAVVLGMAAGSGAASRARAVTWTLLAALPGVLLLLAANRAATGHAFAWPEGAYFAATDGPPGCHRYGFGAGIGCEYDDGVLEGRTLAHGGFGIGAAALVTLQRLRAHLLDVSNLEPLALLALVPAFRGPAAARRPAVLALLVVAGAILVRVPYYLANVGPGSGARLLVDVIPIEHALMAVAVVRLAPQAIAAAASVTLALSLAGFGVHASFEHEKLAASDMGRPRYEPDVAREANVTYGLLFFEDDAGYELAADPGVLASHGVQAVRMRGDDHDRLLYDSLGHPPIHKYTLAATGASVAYWSPPGGGGETWRFEAEADWPPVNQTLGWAQPVTVGSCASDSRALVVNPVAGQEATVTIELPVPRGPVAPEKKTWQIIPRVVQRGGSGTGTIDLVVAPGGESIAHWAWADATTSTGKPPADTCTELPAQPVELGGDRTRAWLVLRAKGGAVTLDKTTVRPK